ncbi:hypothetical protein L7F22_048579 [Adiantum nelumboides]|nr:hypothetical protein [Adiantum nelumboides]
MPPHRTAPPARRRSRTRALVLLAVLALLALTGCTRVQVALAVQPDDTVDGTIVVATPEGAPDGRGPQLEVPADLAGEVELSPYDQDGFVGTRAAFENLTFAQVSQLNLLGGNASGRANLELRRVGERIAVQGRADLTTMPVDRADVRLAMSFPGEVVESDGETDGGTVTWEFVPARGPRRPAPGGARCRAARTAAPRSPPSARGPGSTGPAGGGVGDDGAPVAQHREVLRQVLGERDLDDPVDRPGGVEDRGAGVAVAVVDDVVRAGGAGQLGLLRTGHGGHHGRAGPPGQLDPVVPDRAGTAGDQHGQVVRGAVGEQAVVGGHGRDAEAGAQVVGRAVGQHRGLLGRQHRVLRAGAPLGERGASGAARRREPGPDPLPDPGRVDPLPHGVDLAHAVLLTAFIPAILPSRTPARTRCRDPPSGGVAPLPAGAATVARAAARRASARRRRTRHPTTPATTATARTVQPAIPKAFSNCSAASRSRKPGGHVHRRPDRRPDGDGGQEPPQRQPGRPRRGRGHRAHHRQEPGTEHRPRAPAAQRAGGVVPGVAAHPADDPRLAQPRAEAATDRVADRVAAGGGDRDHPGDQHRGRDVGDRHRGGDEHGLAGQDQPDADRGLAEGDQPRDEHHHPQRDGGQEVDDLGDGRLLGRGDGAASVDAGHPVGGQLGLGVGGRGRVTPGRRGPSGPALRRGRGRCRRRGGVRVVAVPGVGRCPGRGQPGEERRDLRRVDLHRDALAAGPVVGPAGGDGAEGDPVTAQLRGVGEHRGEVPALVEHDGTVDRLHQVGDGRRVGEGARREEPVGQSREERLLAADPVEVPLGQPVPLPDELQGLGALHGLRARGEVRAGVAVAHRGPEAHRDAAERAGDLGEPGQVDLGVVVDRDAALPDQVRPGDRGTARQRRVDLVCAEAGDVDPGVARDRHRGGAEVGVVRDADQHQGVGVVLAVGVARVQGVEDLAGQRVAAGVDPGVAADQQDVGRAVGDVRSGHVRGGQTAGAADHRPAGAGGEEDRDRQCRDEAADAVPPRGGGALLGARPGGDRAHRGGGAGAGVGGPGPRAGRRGAIGAPPRAARRSTGDRARRTGTGRGAGARRRRAAGTGPRARRPGVPRRRTPGPGPRRARSRRDAGDTGRSAAARSRRASRTPRPRRPAARGRGAAGPRGRSPPGLQTVASLTQLLPYRAAPGAVPGTGGAPLDRTIGRDGAAARPPPPPADPPVTPGEPALRHWAGADAFALLRGLESARRGLCEDTAALRLHAHGDNATDAVRRPGAAVWARRALAGPFSGLMTVLGVLLAVAGSPGSATLVLVVAALGVGLRLWHAARSDRLSRELRAHAATTVTVRRRPAPGTAPRDSEVPPEDLVPGDVVLLGAGDPVRPTRGCCTPGTCWSTSRRCPGSCCRWRRRRRRRGSRARRRGDGRRGRGPTTARSPRTRRCCSPGAPWSAAPRRRSCWPPGAHPHRGTGRARPPSPPGVRGAAVRRRRDGRPGPGAAAADRRDHAVARRVPAARVRGAGHPPGGHPRPRLDRRRLPGQDRHAHRGPGGVHPLRRRRRPSRPRPGRRGRGRGALPDHPARRPRRRRVRRRPGRVGAAGPRPAHPGRGAALRPLPAALGDGAARRARPRRAGDRAGRPGHRAPPLHPGVRAGRDHRHRGPRRRGARRAERRRAGPRGAAHHAVHPARAAAEGAGRRRAAGLRAHRRVPRRRSQRRRRAADRRRRDRRRRSGARRPGGRGHRAGRPQPRRRRLRGRGGQADPGPRHPLPDRDRGAERRQRPVGAGRLGGAAVPAAAARAAAAAGRAVRGGRAVAVVRPGRAGLDGAARRWDTRGMLWFMAVLGPLASAFDLVTFWAVWRFLGLDTPQEQAVFQAVWFMEGVLSQVLVLLLLRTRAGRAARPVVATVTAVVLAGLAVPFTPLAPLFGMAAPPPAVWPLLAAVVLPRRRGSDDPTRTDPAARRPAGRRAAVRREETARPGPLGGPVHPHPEVRAERDPRGRRGPLRGPGPRGAARRGARGPGAGRGGTDHRRALTVAGPGTHVPAPRAGSEQRGPVGPEALQDQPDDHQEPQHHRHRVVAGDPGVQRTRATAEGVQGREQRVPEDRDRHGPHDHAVRAERADPVQALDDQVVHEDDAERGPGRQPHPPPAREAGPGQQGRTRRHHDRERPDPEQRVREPEERRLRGRHDRPAGQHRVDAARRRVGRVDQQLDALDGQRERRDQPQHAADDEQPRQEPRHRPRHGRGAGGDAGELLDRRGALDAGGEPGVLVGLDLRGGRRVGDGGVVGVQVEAEILGVAAEHRRRVRGLGPVALGLEQALVHRVERALGAGRLTGERGGLGVLVHRQREVAEHELHAVAVLLHQLVHDRLDLTAGGALEVGELDQGGRGVRGVVEAGGVGGDEAVGRTGGGAGLRGAGSRREQQRGHDQRERADDGQGDLDVAGHRESSSTGPARWPEVLHRRRRAQRPFRCGGRRGAGVPGRQDGDHGDRQQRRDGHVVVAAGGLLAVPACISVSGCCEQSEPTTTAGVVPWAPGAVATAGPAHSTRARTSNAIGARTRTCLTPPLRSDHGRTPPAAPTTIPRALAAPVLPHGPRGWRPAAAPGRPVAGPLRSVRELPRARRGVASRRDHRTRRHLPTGSWTRFAAPGAEVGGGFGLFESWIPADSPGALPHLHTGFTESFYVLDGALRVMTGDTWTEAGPGDLVQSDVELVGEGVARADPLRGEPLEVRVGALRDSAEDLPGSVGDRVTGERDGGLLQREAVDEGVDERERVARGAGVVAVAQQRAEHGVVVGQRRGPGSATAVEQRHGPGVAGQRGPRRTAATGQLGPPRPARHRRVDLAEDRVDETVEDLVLVRHVVVDGHRCAAQPPGDGADGECRDAVGVGDLGRRGEHPFPAELSPRAVRHGRGLARRGAARAGAGAGRGPGAGGRGGAGPRHLAPHGGTAARGAPGRRVAGTPGPGPGRDLAGTVVAVGSASTGSAPVTACSGPPPPAASPSTPSPGRPARARPRRVRPGARRGRAGVGADRLAGGAPGRQGRAGLVGAGAGRVRRGGDVRRADRPGRRRDGHRGVPLRLGRARPVPGCHRRRRPDDDRRVRPGPPVRRRPRHRRQPVRGPAVLGAGTRRDGGPDRRRAPGRTADRRLRPAAARGRALAAPARAAARRAGGRRERADLAALRGLVEAGELAPVVDRIVGLDDAGAAIERLAADRVRGKVVVRVAGPTTPDAVGDGRRGGPGSADQTRPERQRDELHPVTRLRLGEQVPDVGLHRRLETTRSARISALDRPLPTRTSTSRSRGVRSASAATASTDGSAAAGSGAVSSGRVARSSRRVETGSTTESPRCTVRTASMRSCGDTSLSRKPLAPAAMASVTDSSRSKVVSTRTRTPGCSATTRRVAAMPSRRGIRTSISTTSTSVRSSSASAASPSPAWATTARSSHESSTIAKPVRTSSWSSTSISRTGSPFSSGRGCEGQAQPDRPAAVGVRTGLDRAAVQGGALPHAGQAVAAARWGGDGAAGALVVDAHGQLVGGPPQVDVGGHAGPGVLDDVGQRLLHDPVDGQAGTGRELPRGADGPQVDRQPAGADLLDERGDVTGAGLRTRRVGVGVVVRTGVAQHRQQAADVGQRGPARRRDAGEHLDGLRRVALRGELAAVGLGDDPGQRVRDDVVHLAGDPRPLGQQLETDLLAAALLQQPVAFAQVQGAAVRGAAQRSEQPHQQRDRRHRAEQGQRHQRSHVRGGEQRRGTTCHERSEHPDGEHDQRQPAGPAGPVGHGRVPHDQRRQEERGHRAGQREGTDQRDDRGRDRGGHRVDPAQGHGQRREHRDDERLDPHVGADALALEGPADRDPDEQRGQHGVEDDGVAPPEGDGPLDQRGRLRRARPECGQPAQGVPHPCRDAHRASPVCGSDDSRYPIVSAARPAVVPSMSPASPGGRPAGHRSAVRSRVSDRGRRPGHADRDAVHQRLQRTAPDEPAPGPRGGHGQDRDQRRRRPRRGLRPLAERGEQRDVPGVEGQRERAGRRERGEQPSPVPGGEQTQAEHGDGDPGRPDDVERAAAVRGRGEQPGGRGGGDRAQRAAAEQLQRELGGHTEPVGDGRDRREERVAAAQDVQRQPGSAVAEHRTGGPAGDEPGARRTQVEPADRHPEQQEGHPGQDRVGTAEQHRVERVHEPGGRGEVGQVHGRAEHRPPVGVGRGPEPGAQHPGQQRPGDRPDRGGDRQRPGRGEQHGQEQPEQHPVDDEDDHRPAADLGQEQPEDHQEQSADRDPATQPHPVPCGRRGEDGRGHQGQRHPAEHREQHRRAPVHRLDQPGRPRGDGDVRDDHAEHGEAAGGVDTGHPGAPGTVPAGTVPAARPRPAVRSGGWRRRWDGGPVCRGHAATVRVGAARARRSGERSAPSDHGRRVARVSDPFAVQVDDERTQLTAFVEEYRTLVAGVLDGLTEEQARRRLVPSATTLIGLVRHAAFVETVWFGMAVSGRSRAELEIPDSVEESFLPGADETVDSVRRHYLQVCERSRAAVAGLGLDDTVSGRGYPITVRWLLLQHLRRYSGASGPGRGRARGAAGAVAAGAARLRGAGRRPVGTRAAVRSGAGASGTPFPVPGPDPVPGPGAVPGVDPAPAVGPGSGAPPVPRRRRRAVPCRTRRRGPAVWCLRRGVAGPAGPGPPGGCRASPGSYPRPGRRALPGPSRNRRARERPGRRVPPGRPGPVHPGPAEPRRPSGRGRYPGPGAGPRDRPAAPPARGRVRAGPAAGVRAGPVPLRRDGVVALPRSGGVLGHRGEGRRAPRQAGGHPVRAGHRRRVGRAGPARAVALLRDQRDGARGRTGGRQQRSGQHHGGEPWDRARRDRGDTVQGRVGAGRGRPGGPAVRPRGAAVRRGPPAVRCGGTAGRHRVLRRRDAREHAVPHDGPGSRSTGCTASGSAARWSGSAGSGTAAG